MPNGNERQCLHCGEPVRPVAAACASHRMELNIRNIIAWRAGYCDSDCHVEATMTAVYDRTTWWQRAESTATGHPDANKGD